MVEQSGRYRATRVLGRGGMAEVLEGVIAGAGGFERRVAIKRILPEHAGDASFSRMFLDEARIASRLHHANVVAILDFGIADGIPFQVLELVEGIDASSLRKAVTSAGNVFPVEVALHVCIEIAHALAHAHGACGDDGKPLGIVHRDVSPHNILVSWNGDVKLTDFGIALARDRSEKTETGIAKGKLAYMAPEQAVGGEVDGRADVFALGCALHALLAGKSPLAGEDRMSQLLTGVPLDVDPSLPEDVRPVIERAIRRSKLERFASAAAMADAMSEILSARIDRDARRVLRDWLTSLRPLFPAPDAGVPVALELVLEDGHERTFRVTGAHTAVPTVRLGRSPARYRRLGVLSSLAVAALLGAWALGGPGRKPIPAPLPTGTPVAQAPTPETIPAQSPPVTPLVVSPPRSPARTAVVPRPSPTSSGSGVLVIGGVGAQRAEILVDGESRGFAPKLIELPAGPHDVVLVKTDGGRIGPKRFDVGRHHTRSAPLRWTVEP